MLDTVFCDKVPVICCCSDLVLPPLLRNQIFQYLLTLCHFFVCRQKPIGLTSKQSADLDTAKEELFSHIFFNLDGCVFQELPLLRLDLKHLPLVKISKMLFKNITLLFLFRKRP